MNILVIHGSPHKGHTLQLTKKFEEALKKIGDVQFEYLSVSELNIHPCNGCFTCITKGEHFCPFKNDDVQQIIQKMDDAHGTIIAAPTYMYNTPAVMKNLIDRLSYLGHRPRYVAKPAMVISTTCGVGLKQSLQYLSFGTTGAWGFKLIGKLGAYTHPFYFDQKSRKKLDTTIHHLSEKFYTSLIQTKKPTVGFQEMMRYRIMKLNSYYSKEFFPADYAFYHNNKQQENEYYTSVKITLFGNIASKLMAFIIARYMRKKRNHSDLNQKFLDW